MTFGDGFTILTALISTKLKLNGISVEGARIAYSKHEIHTYLNKFPETRDFATHTHRIRSENDVSSAFQTISLPGILKTEFGSGAYCVTKVHNKDECLNIFKNFQQINNSSIRNEYTAEYALIYGVSLVLMDYIQGTEHDINVIIYNGQLIGAFVNDNGPTRKDSFFETTSSLPTCLTKEQTDKLIKAAYLCCIQLGLLNGVFNVEMKMTKTGPKLLEINSRIPGFYSRNWILELYGIDLANCAFQISFGIKPDIPGTLTPKGHIMGVMCVISIHNKTLQQPHIKKRLVKLRQHKEIGYIEMIKEEEWDSINPDLDWVCCNIAVKERDLETAKRKLLNISDDLDINKPEYPVQHFLKDFQNTNGQ